jgi:dolichyl-phosphate beta-glucosyltransferase
MLSGTTIIIPAYREATRLPKTLTDLRERIQQQELAPLNVRQVLVIDDGSDDNTRIVAFQNAASLPGFDVITLNPNQGKGAAVREGARRSQCEWTLMADADLSTPWTEGIKLAYQVTQENADIAIGSRDIQGSQIKVHQSWLRENLGRTFNRFVRLLSGLPFKDTQCGFKLWRTHAIQTLLPYLHVNRFAWDVEWLMTARAAELHTIEVPVEWEHRERSSVHLWVDGLEMVRSVLWVRLSETRSKRRLLLQKGA